MLYSTVFPLFVETLQDATVRTGTTARLECAAVRQPAPEVAWQKDGGYDLPAACERRMYVMPSDHVFLIIDTFKCQPLCCTYIFWHIAQFITSLLKIGSRTRPVCWVSFDSRGS